MKKPSATNPLKKILISAASLLLVAAITGTCSFAFSLRDRVTRLETAFISAATDLHDMKQDIKQLLDRER